MDGRRDRPYDRLSIGDRPRLPGRRVLHRKEDEMRRAGVLAAVGLMALAGVATADGGKIQWLKDYDQGLAMAQQTGRPMIVKFFTTW